MKVKQPTLKFDSNFCCSTNGMQQHQVEGLDAHLHILRLQIKISLGGVLMIDTHGYFQHYAKRQTYIYIYIYSLLHIKSNQ